MHNIRTYVYACTFPTLVSWYGEDSVICHFFTSQGPYSSCPYHLYIAYTYTYNYTHYYNGPH